MKTTTINRASAILAGGLMFAGSASAAVSFVSTFDDGASPLNDGSWTGFATYAYSQGYTATAPAGAGSHYGKTNADSLTTSIDVTNGGADSADIAAGNVTFEFGAFLGSYVNNIDRAQISYEFRDGGGCDYWFCHYF